MKEGWNSKKLSELFSIRPQKKQAKEKLNDNNEISFVPMECLNVYDRNLTLNQTRTLKDVYSGYTYFEDNDVLLAKITPCFENGKIGIARNLRNGIGFGSSEFIVFRSQGEVIPEYLYYYLSQESFRQEGKAMMAGAVGHKRVSKDFINDYKLPFPESLKEQKRIVAILDESFAAIDKAKANAEKNIANSNELFDSYLNGIFSNLGEDWEENRLGEIALKIGSGATPRGGRKSYKDHGISLIRSLNVHDDEFKYNNLAFIDESQANKLSNVTVESKDVLLNITGASIARCNIVPDDILPARVNQHVSIIRLKPSTVLPEFLHYMLISKQHKEKLLFTGDKNGATRQALTKTLVENYQITYPEFEEQKDLLKKIKSIKTESIHLKKIFEQKITALNELKKSVLKKAFEGEL